MIRHLLQRNSQAYTVVALVTVAALVSGCSKKESPAPVVAPSALVQVKQRQISSVQKRLSSASVKLAPLPASNQFDFSGKKDPFKPDIALKTAAAPLPEDMKKALQGGLPIHSLTSASSG
jgi:type IV pilus assembly protein PilP